MELLILFIQSLPGTGSGDQVLRTTVLVETKGTVAFRIAPGFQSLGWALGKDESPEDRNCGLLAHHMVAAQ